MDFIEIVKRRYSVRSYKDKKVEEEKLQKILEADPASISHALLCEASATISDEWLNCLMA